MRGVDHEKDRAGSTENRLGYYLQTWVNLSEESATDLLNFFLPADPISQI